MKKKKKMSLQFQSAPENVQKKIRKRERKFICFHGFYFKSDK